MSEEAKSLARKARKAVPANMYEFARAFEKAIEELADEIEAFRRQAAGDRR